ncbi:imidazole glycerol phosphate synthase HisH [Gottschalkia acidurici 9a]|uniref:Imidazole glycerol phosphate synthase subunit HisH n=1 Tax=Gottschalkia acidurici (strain ATCC 7906 / DSM 604 / BCRC 14475 / CIP 104303 / KCTC 5404 / NCIMB 10678 / 9a) TaxID=1128398 RepID=K0B112_GOTA9|nr:imidazole glycerol phosphate synthase subunit HisH [Gottschalkia acidurici]AFS78762.1 imidazole glycerol phosphate synthase HisH [Gottschalkia acidurici 9a]
MISIIDYGVGNLNSVHKALEKLGFQVNVTNNIQEINNSKAIILPGVGAFNDAMENLKKSNLIQCIRENVDKGKPLLGICLGMQLLYEKSFEDGEWEGLGFLKGEVVKFNEDVKIPHMGWNRLKINKNNDVLKYIKEEDYVYFVHSYYAKSNFDEVIAYSDYGVKVPGIVSRGNIYGMQFHPEKSGDVGLNLLKAFGGMIK